MQHTRIKICGITRPEDATEAARLGATAIGLVFHLDSPRGISASAGRAVIAALPPFVTPIGLFVGQEPREILRLAAELGLQWVQLNGSENPAAVAALSPLNVIKSIPVDESFAKNWQRWSAASKKDAPNLRAIVLETAGTGVPGGSGVENDWQRVAAVDQTIGPPVIAAGGLRPQNVGSVVRSIRPFAVDVSSGIERTRGVKDYDLMRAFFEAVRAADAA